MKRQGNGTKSYWKSTRRSTRSSSLYVIDAKRATVDPASGLLRYVTPFEFPVGAEAVATCPRRFISHRANCKVAAMTRGGTDCYYVIHRLINGPSRRQTKLLGCDAAYCRRARIHACCAIENSAGGPSLSLSLSLSSAMC